METLRAYPAVRHGIEERGVAVSGGVETANGRGCATAYLDEGVNDFTPKTRYGK
ncbi:hypothetical protein [Nocardia sp. NPDC050793]|uniref:hypothetical protein n=1 Tax=Nocardia sp. NPDC050793 TaxID=3155159 RepID=UPI0033CF0D33